MVTGGYARRALSWSDGTGVAVALPGLDQLGSYQIAPVDAVLHIGPDGAELVAPR